MRYEPEGQTPIALVSAATIATSPQTFTAAELGRLTLPDDTRGDLVFEAAAGAASSSSTVFVRVFTQRPGVVTEPRVKALGPNSVELSFILPAERPNIPAVNVNVEWTKELASTGPAESVPVEIGTSPKKVPAIGPNRTWVALVNSDESQPLYCATDNPAVTPATATHVAPVRDVAGKNGVLWVNVTNPPCTMWRPCDLAVARKKIYCVRAAPASAVSVSWDTAAPDWDRRPSLSSASPCMLRDPSATPQAWECDGRKFAPGDRFAMRIGGLTSGRTHHFRVRPEN